MGVIILCIFAIPDIYILTLDYGIEETGGGGNKSLPVRKLLQNNGNSRFYVTLKLKRLLMGREYYRTVFPSIPIIAILI